MLLQVAHGRDPQADRVAARTAPTVADMADRYMLELGNHQKSAANMQDLIRIQILPKLGRERVADPDYTMVER